MEMQLNPFWGSHKEKRGRKSGSYRARETAGNFSLEQSENFLPPKEEKADPEDQTTGNMDQNRLHG